MIRYSALRVGQAVVVLIGAYTLTFFGIQALPGDPITTYLASNDLNLDPATVESMKAYYGYDVPVLHQYVAQLGRLLQGQLGYSIVSGRSVLAEVGDAVGPTLRLASLAVLLAVLLSISIVTYTQLGRSTRLRSLVRGFPPLMAAIPTFWLSLVVLQVLSFRLGIMSIFPDGSLLSLFVPALMLAIFVSAPLSQVTLEAVDRAQEQPFVTALRAKGAGRRRIYVHHLLKYVAGGALTLLALMIGALLAGAVVTETVFSRPGVGRVLESAVSHQDVALVQGFVLLTAIGYVVVNLVVDLLYPLLDPRIVQHRTQPEGA